MNQFVLIIGAVILLIVAGQSIMQRELTRQKDNAHIINLAGRQRMLSQRLAMTILYARDELNKTGHVSSRTLDSLDLISTQWKKVHFILLEETNESAEAHSLLQTNTPGLERIYGACQDIIQDPGYRTLEKALTVLKRDETVYLLNAEQTVAAYEDETHRNARNTQRTALILASMAPLLLAFLFIYTFRPLYREFHSTKRKMAEIRMELSHTKDELKESEEDLKNNLSYIRLLQSDLQQREEQYQRIIDDIGEIMYELDENGKFSYANLALEKISEYPKEELFKKYYWDLVHPAHKERVTEFYKKQRKDLLEATYMELNIVTKGGKEIKIGQHVRMFFSGKWVTKVMVIARQLPE